MATMNGWQALVRGLEREGIPVVFGLPGSPKHLYDALYDSASVRAVLVRHETSGSFMAMAWTRITNTPAACFGCPGPGVANMVPGILEAYSGCTPMLVLGVRAPARTNGMGAFQEADHVGMLRPITKWAATIERLDRTDWYLRRALSIATNGQPGPVYLEFPADIALEQAEFGDYHPADRAVRPAPDPAAIRRAADLIAQAKRPLIVCGGGSVLSGAGEALTALIDTFGIPVQTTPAGRGVIGERHPLACGMVGLYRTTFPRELYDEADLLITVGSRMEEFQSANFTYFPPGARFVQIDIEPSELGRNWVPDVAIQADAALALRALHAALVERGVTRDDARVADVQERRAAAIEDAQADARATSGAPVRGKRIVHEINRVFGDNTILVKENGGQDLWAYYWPYYQAFDAGCVVPPAEQTVMGLGVVGAIAAKMAAPERQVVSTTGDGAFQMAMHELPTAVQERAPVTWVVLNDGKLGWPRWTQTRTGGRYIATEFDPQFDFVAVARAAGCAGSRVEDTDALAGELERARRANADGVPFVVDVAVDPSEHHPEFVAFHEVR